MKILFTIILFITSLHLHAQKIVGYLPYYKGVSQTADYTLYTHLHYFAIWPAADGSLTYPSAQDSVGMANQFSALKEKLENSDTKLIITFGGTAENGSEHFAAMAKNETTRGKFKDNVMALVNAWEADGIDIDWEWGSPNSPEEDRIANGVLIAELRELCTEASITLSVDISPSANNGKNYDATKMALADYINVMSYSYNGAWASTANHHSPMVKIESLGLEYWMGRGLQKEKLNIGTAFYGFKYNGTYQPGTAFTSTTTLNYTQVKQYIADGYTVVEDNWNGTYCYSELDNAIIYYDSPSNIAHKMAYAKDSSYSGIIIWEIGQDDTDQTLSKSLQEDEVTTNLTIDNPSVYHIKYQQGELVIHSETPIQLEVSTITGVRLFKGLVNSLEQRIPINISPQLIIIKSENQKEWHVQKMMMY